MPATWGKEARARAYPSPSSKPDQDGADQLTPEQIAANEAVLARVKSSARALDATPTVFLVAYEVLQAIGALGLEVHISAQICLGTACYDLPRVKLSASDIADVTSVVLTYLGGLAGAVAGTVGSQPAAGFAPAATKMAVLAAQSGLWP